MAQNLTDADVIRIAQLKWDKLRSNLERTNNVKKLELMDSIFQSHTNIVDRYLALDDIIKSSRATSAPEPVVERQVEPEPVVERQVEPVVERQVAPEPVVERHVRPQPKPKKPKKPKIRDLDEIRRMIDRTKVDFDRGPDLDFDSVLDFDSGPDLDFDRGPISKSEDAFVIINGEKWSYFNGQELIREVD